MSHLENLGEVGWPIHLCGWLGIRHHTAFIVLTSQISITQNSMHFPKCLKFKCRILLLIFIWMPLQRGLVVALLDLCRSCLLLHSKQAVQICMVSKGLLNQSHGLVRSKIPNQDPIYLGQCKWNNFYYPDIWHPYSKFMKLRTSIGHFDATLCAVLPCGLEIDHDLGCGNRHEMNIPENLSRAPS